MTYTRAADRLSAKIRICINGGNRNLRVYFPNPLLMASRNTLGLFVLLAFSVSKVSAGSLGQALDHSRTAHNIGALAFFIVNPATIETLEAFGATSRNSEAQFSVDHLIRIGSITKAFTALTTMLLVSRGQLTLDTKVSDILQPPPFHNPWKKTHPVRIAHLLEHTAGLRDLSKKEFAFNQPISLDAAFALDPKSRHLAWQPGMHASYSNSGAGIISKVIESITSSPFEAFVSREIFRPLAMPSTRFSLSADEKAQLITGYDRDGKTPIEYWHTLYRAFGAISVSTRDMVPFVQLFLNNGKVGAFELLGAREIERMEGPRTTLAARSGLAYGYGLGVYQFQRRGYTFFGHGGDADGYLAYFAYSRTLRRGYFIVINAFNSAAMSEMRILIENEIIGDTRLAAPPAEPLPNSHLQLLAGTYRRTTRRFARSSDDEFIISIANGRLYTRVSGQSRQELIPNTRWHFRRASQNAPTIAFIPCGETLYVQGDFGNYARLFKGERSSACARAATR